MLVVLDCCAAELSWKKVKFSDILIIIIIIIILIIIIIIIIIILIIIIIIIIIIIMLIMENKTQISIYQGMKIKN